jgi:hypothetical protein
LETSEPQIATKLSSEVIERLSANLPNERVERVDIDSKTNQPFAQDQDANKLSSENQHPNEEYKLETSEPVLNIESEKFEPVSDVGFKANESVISDQLSTKLPSEEYRFEQKKPVLKIKYENGEPQAASKLPPEEVNHDKTLVHDLAQPASEEPGLATTELVTEFGPVKSEPVAKVQATTGQESEKSSLEKIEPLAEILPDREEPQIKVWTEEPRSERNEPVVKARFEKVAPVTVLDQEELVTDVLTEPLSSKKAERIVEVKPEMEEPDADVLAEEPRSERNEPASKIRVEKFVRFAEVGSDKEESDTSVLTEEPRPEKIEHFDEVGPVKEDPEADVVIGHASEESRAVAETRPEHIDHVVNMRSEHSEPVVEVIPEKNKLTPPSTEVPRVVSEESSSSKKKDFRKEEFSSRSFQFQTDIPKPEPAPRKFRKSSQQKTTSDQTSIQIDPVLPKKCLGVESSVMESEEKIFVDE